MNGKFDEFDALAKALITAIKEGAATAKSISITEDRIAYVANDGERLDVHGDGAWESRYGTITPEYLLEEVRAETKARRRAKYEAGRAVARDEAIAWQSGLTGGESMSELADAQARFERLAKRYGLTAEFRENGII